MMKKQQVVLFLALLFSSLLHAETSVWKVSKGQSHMYLGGTIHMLSATDFPLPQAFDQAYSDAARVVLETDMAVLLQPQFQMQLMSRLSYQDGRLLNQIISAELYAELNQYLRARGMLPNLFIGMKPAGVMLTMLAIEFQRLGISESGADTVYYQRAVADGKAVAGLESIESHLNYIAGLGEGNEETFLRQSLEDSLQTEQMMRQIVKAWKQGDVPALERLVVSDMQQYYPAVYQSLLVERNLNWLPQIQRMLDNQEVELVLVGAAHLIGPDGILRALAAQGYQIEQL
ncbi:TraB/GumN family protein [Neptuniibacter halophilus]|uniref:TraB/GumN family protein n=1 Tax=Neptuniibacter halophilus TaxID=651666 RepID=UPI002572684E|nr:TraB/GumN family protein [Neptuniibacter halophilus]